MRDAVARVNAARKILCSAHNGRRERFLRRFSGIEKATEVMNPESKAIGLARYGDPGKAHRTGFFAAAQNDKSSGFRLTQAAIADAVGMAPNRLSRLERMQAVSSADLRKIDRLLCRRALEQAEIGY